MRIRHLDLRAFGPFTDRRLTFLAEPGDLHLIYGPNEAGKSSALRAIGAALFGIESQTSDNFKHAYSDLRLGMSLERPGEKVLEFVRRKGQKQKLWAGDDSHPLDDDILSGFLGGLDRAEFTRVFGLDHLRLREGTERLLDAAEGTEAAVVGAALGVRDLSEVRVQLEKEAAELFSLQARKPRINKAFLDWREKKKELGKASLSTEAWKQARRKVEQALAARDEILQSERDRKERLSEFEFVRRNRPRVKDWRHLETELQALEEVASLGPDFANRYGLAEEARREALRGRDQFANDERDLIVRLAALPEMFPLCEQVPRLDKLREEASKVRVGVQDGERLRARAELCEAAADEVASALGFAIPLTKQKVAQLKLLMGAPADFCRHLLAEHAGIQATFAEGAERIFNGQADLAAAEQALQNAGEAVETSGLLAVRRAALKLGNPEAELAGLREQEEQLARAIDRDLARLPGISEAAETLLQRTLPGAEVLETFRQRFQDVDTEEREARTEVRNLGLRRAAIESQLESVAEGEDLPTMTALTDARSRRDQLWTLVQEAWLSGADNAEAARSLDAERSLPDALTFSIRHGDRVSDRLRLESERVAEIAQLRRQMSEFDRIQKSLSEAEISRKSRAETLDQEWADAWKSSGLLVGDWPAMQDAIPARDAIRVQVEERESCSFRIDQLQGRIENVRAEICEAIASCGGHPPESSRSLADCLAIADAFGEELEARSQIIREAHLKHADLLAAANKDQQAQDRRRDQLASWDVKFATATKDFPLREEEPPEAVERVLRQIEALLKDFESASGFRERIEKIDALREGLDTDLLDFCRTYAPDLPELDRAGALTQLFQILEEQKVQRQDHERLSAKLLAKQDAGQAAERTLKAAESDLSALTTEAAVETLEDLPECIRKADVKRQLLEKRDTLTQHFSGEDVAVEDLVVRVEGMGAVDLEAEMIPLQAELDSISANRAALVEEATLANAEFQALENDTGADDLAIDMADVAAGLRDPVARYATLLFSSRLLSAAVERYRERNEAPLLGYASAYFSRLTRGRYDRIETDMDGSSEGGFRVRSTASPQSKALSSLSEGTVDQLHLALVLGSLEHRFAAGAEAMPLLLDDILVHFDDERSMAALETLVEFAKTTQVLLFTHHERVRDQAMQAGGSIHDLQGAVPEL